MGGGLRVLADGREAVPAKRNRMPGRGSQKEHRESSGKEGLILEYLEKPVPENWNSMKLMDRRTYLNGNMKAAEDMKLVPRMSVCAMEIWVECFGSDPRYIGNAGTVAEIKQSIPALGEV